MSRESPITLVGYCAAAGADLANLTPKNVMMLWEGASGSAGLVYWSGVAWKIESFVAHDAAEHAAIKRKAPKARIDSLENLGEDAYGIGLRRWSERSMRAGSEKQIAFAERLGLKVPAGFPVPLLSVAISAIRQAKDVLREPGEGALIWTGFWLVDREQARVALDRVSEQDWEGRHEALWEAISALFEAVFRRPDRPVEEVAAMMRAQAA